MNRNLLGYDTLVITLPAFQEGLPPGAIPPGGTATPEQRARGEGIVEFRSPDGRYRPLAVRLEFQRCKECRALVLDEDANAHTDWHGRVGG